MQKSKKIDDAFENLLHLLGSSNVVTRPKTATDLADILVEARAQSIRLVRAISDAEGVLDDMESFRFVASQ